jgi:hypothetical protein
VTGLHRKTTSPVGAGPFWRDLLERLGRQAAQVALPIVLAAGTTHSLDIPAVALAIGVAVGVSVLKTLAGITAGPDDALAWRLLDRVVAAMAGTALGFIPLDLGQLITVDWDHVAIAALAAGLTSLLAYYVTPPATSTPPLVDPPPPTP